MTPSKYERQVILFNLTVRAVPDEAPSAPMVSVIDLVQRQYDAEEAFWALGAKAIADENDDEAADQAIAAGERPSLLVLADIERQNGGACLLFNFADVVGPDPALLNMRTRRVRVIRRSAQEGTGYGAHLYISAHHIRDMRHRCALEIMPHLGRGRVIQFLNRLLRLGAKDDPAYTFPSPETRRDLKYRPKLSSSLQPSKALIRDIREGKLSHIEFYTREVVSQADELPQIVSERRSLRVKVRLADHSPRAIAEFVRNAMRYGAQRDFPEMQLRFARGDIDKNASVRFSTGLADAADALYSRTERIAEFDGVLPQCPEHLHPQIREKLAELIADNTLWQ